MSTSRPWYKRYPAHYLAGTYRLTAEEKGVYSTLLDLMYDRGGPIEDDAKELARICGCSTRRFNTIKRDLALTHGKLVLRDGLIINERALEQIGVDLVAVYPGDNAGLSGGKEPEKSPKNRPPPNKNKHLAIIEKEGEKELTPPTPPPGVSGIHEWEEFERRWERSDAKAPNVREAFLALSPPDRQAAVAGIAAFRAEEDRLRRGTLGARRYLAERRWAHPEREACMRELAIDPSWPNWRAWKAYAPQRKNDIGVSRLERSMAFCEDQRIGTEVVVVAADWPPDYAPSEAESAALAVRKAAAMSKRRIA
ncbi:MAG: DUF1376 domain-containing protein [Methyloceanibacter sp.]